MPNLIRFSGPYGYFLALLALVVFFIAGRAAWVLLRAPTPGPKPIQEQLNGLLFWGGVAAVLGLLGQCDGSYRAVSAILAAPEISPDIVAEGFVISFVPTLFGLGILGFSLGAWASLRLLARGRAHLAVSVPSLFLFLLVLSGCSGRSESEGPRSISDGVWALDAGPDEFLWEFSETGSDLTCLVHNVAKGKKVNETPCGAARRDGSALAVSMDTGVRLEGEIEVERGRIRGRLLYPDGSEAEARLPWRARGAYPALSPLGDMGDGYTYSPPKDRDDGWKVAAAQSVGIEPAVLVAIVDAIERAKPGFSTPSLWPDTANWSWRSISTGTAPRISTPWPPAPRASPPSWWDWPFSMAPSTASKAD